MTCPRGYNVNVVERDVVRALRANGKTTHVLYELAPNWQDVAHMIPKRGSHLSTRSARCFDDNAPAVANCAL